MGTRIVGTVAAFDEFVGVGEIDTDGVRYPFHCTQLDDGTRTVAAGQSVEFETMLGPYGRPEATRITKR